MHRRVVDRLVDGGCGGGLVAGAHPGEVRVLRQADEYRHYINVTNWTRLPGTTEDGIERQKLIATAIIEKKDRILAHDLLRVWLRDLDPAKMIYKQERFDRSLLELARAGVPPSELGRLWPFPNVNSVARASPRDRPHQRRRSPGCSRRHLSRSVSSTRPSTTSALRWAALYNAAIAEACKPAATVESVIATAKEFIRYRAEAGSLYALYDTIEKEVTRAFDLAAKHEDPMAMRDEFYDYYNGADYFNYRISQANEMVAKGLAVFALTKGDPKQAILVSCNFGRDTDCLAAVSAGLAGALSGPSSLPKEWIAQVDEATLADPYTNNKRTIEQTVHGLHEAYTAKAGKLKETLRLMGV